MPTYAVLGATGSTGAALTQHLLTRPDIDLRLYARSAAKLHAAHPALPSRVSVFTGALTDPAFAACVAGADVVFSAVAQNLNEPGVTIAQRNAHALAAAIAAHTATTTAAPAKQPLVVWLGAGPLHDGLFHAPRLVRWLLWSANSHIYGDMRLALAFLREQPFPVAAAAPGALVHGAATGVALSGSEVSQKVSYADLARGMVLMAEEEEWAGKDVGIVATGDVQGSMLPNMRMELYGLFVHFLPGLWRLGRGKLW